MTRRFSMIPAAAVTDRRLCRTALAVLCALGTYTNRAGECWPATTTLAKDIGVSVRMIRRCRGELETCGYIRTTHKPGHRSTYLVVGIAGVDPGHIGSGVGPDPGHIGSATPDTQVPPNDTLNDTKNDNTDSAPKEFDTFWQIYPSRRQHSNPKKPALAKFNAAVKTGTPPADIIRGAENYAAHVRQEETDPQFIPQAKTWLGQERWEQYQTAMPPSEGTYGSDVIH